MFSTDLCSSSPCSADGIVRHASLWLWSRRNVSPPFRYPKISTTDTRSNSPLKETFYCIFETGHLLAITGILNKGNYSKQNSTEGVLHSNCRHSSYTSTHLNICNLILTLRQHQFANKKRETWDAAGQPLWPITFLDFFLDYIILEIDSAFFNMVRGKKKRNLPWATPPPEQMGATLQRVCWKAALTIKPSLKLLLSNTVPKARCWEETKW